MKRIVMDFDNTMGVQGCDVDDGLALLALLGSPDLCTVEGLTTTYGNSTIDVVYQNTLRMKEDLKLDIPVFKGAASADEPLSEAAEFLARICAENPGEICIVATGSLTNLKGAAQVDPNFFNNVAEIALMGGYSKALVINGKIMDELNFSCDAEATLMTLQAPCPVMDALSQNCLPCFYTHDELVSEFSDDSWLMEACNKWFGTMDDWYDWGGFTVWDLLSSMYVIRPDLFEDEIKDVVLYKRWLEVGFLEMDYMEGAPTTKVNLPKIKNMDEFKSFAFRAWHNVLDPLGL